MPAAPSGDWKTPPLPTAHACRLPRFTYQDAGRQWGCEVCGAVWTMVRQAVVVGMEDPPDTSWATTTPITQDPPRGFIPDFDQHPAAPGDSITKVLEHSETCAHRLGTGMCTCSVRKTI